MPFWLVLRCFHPPPFQLGELPYGQPSPSQGGHADTTGGGAPLPHLGCFLNQQDRATCGFIRVRSHGKPGKKKSTGGGVRARWLLCFAVFQLWMCKQKTITNKTALH